MTVLHGANNAKAAVFLDQKAGHKTKESEYFVREFKVEEAVEQCDHLCTKGFCLSL
jgi:hypothetical protein